jgi:hypothetical protein
VNCRPGDLAYIVVPPGFLKTLDGKFVNVGVSGAPCIGGRPAPGRAEWLCEFHVPWVTTIRGEPVTVRKHVLLDSWLRPLRHPGDGAVDEALRGVPKAVTSND